MKTLKQLEQRGASTVEYAIIAALVVAIGIAAFPSLKTALVTAFGTIGTTVTNTASGT